MPSKTPSIEDNVFLDSLRGQSRLDLLRFSQQIAIMIHNNMIFSRFNIEQGHDAIGAEKQSDDCQNQKFDDTG
jgi:hypothetical protein